MSKKIIYLLALLFLMIFAIVAYKIFTGNVKPDKPTKLNFSIFPIEVSIYDPVNFEDNTKGAIIWEWNFGDGKTSPERVGTHTYEQQGTYQVALTVNEKFVDIRKVLVTRLGSREDSLTISGDNKGKVGAKLTFIAHSAGGTSISWKFGESGIIDTVGMIITHVYKKVGTYDVVAINDATKKQGILKVTIAQSSLEPPLKKPLPLSADLKGSLQKLATDGFDHEIYESIINNIMCGRYDIPVIVGNDKFTIDSYCKNLSFMKPKISAVKIQNDPATNCVASIIITEITKQ